MGSKSATGGAGAAGTTGAAGHAGTPLYDNTYGVSTD